ncbi:MAG TPA: hypothetical protein VGR29_06140 [Thermomicrobiales bacterium]|nr:hypothetical protein [Thermomicrobiales bacterium]
MQDRPPPTDPDERRPSSDSGVTPDDVGDAPELDQPDERLSPDVDAEPRQVRVTPTARRRNAPQPGPAQDERDRAEPVEAPAAYTPGLEGQPQATAARSRPWTWPLISLIGLLAVVFVNWLANWLPLNDQTTGEISRENPVPFQPAGWAFLIWPLIYAALFAFVIYGFLPAGRRNSRVRAIGPVFLVANIANIAWIFLWHWERFAASFVAIVVLLGSLAVIYAMLPGPRGNLSSVSRVQRLLVRVPFSLYLGWISIATIAALEVWMINGGWNGGPFGLRGWTVVFLIAGVLVAAVFAFAAKDAIYPLVFAWGYFAIAYEQWDGSSLISILAGSLAIVAAVLTVMAVMLSFGARAGSALPAMPRQVDKPPTAP